MVFTDLYIKNLPHTDKRYDDWEGEGTGLGIRVAKAPSKRKSWQFFYRLKGSPRRRMTLGPYPSISLKEAREMVADLRKLVDRGIDPKEKQQEEEEEAERQRLEAEANELTVARLMERYITFQSKPERKKSDRPRKSSWRNELRMIEKDIVPALGHMKAKEVRRRDVVVMLEAIVDRDAPVSANRTLEVCRSAFTWAVGKDLLDASPMVGIPLPGGSENPRERALSDEEIRHLWHRLPKVFNPRYVALIRLLLLTGQRVGEVAGMPWSEIDGDWWTIPAERNKSRRTHRVPLTQPALEILAQLREIAPGSDFILPAKTKPQGLGTRVADGYMNRMRHYLDMDHWYYHDLRRTASTNMIRIGVDEHIVDRVLNHGKRGVMRHYNVYQYDPEKRAALEAWARELDKIVSGEDAALPSDNVLQFPR